MKSFILALNLVMISIIAAAQEDLLNIGKDSSKTGAEYVTGTFMSTRLLNGQSTERLAGGELDLRIGHRFGTLNSGIYQFFGLDLASIHLGLDYGIFDWMMVGIGRGSYEKTYDGFLKFSVVRQSTGSREIPVSVSLFTSLAIRTLDWEITERNNLFSTRLTYTDQVLVSRKFNNWLSLQLTPTFIHMNLVPAESDPNDLWAVGAGGRIRLTDRINLSAEYFYLANRKTYFTQKVYDPFSIGVDIETPGHVFTLFFTNSQGMIEKAFIGGTTGSWSKGDIHFGFNISRVFILKNHK
jgi:opacity protein-like surface antigen